ncbi:hypothetical protein TA3x_004269 [Tundrisphaera sp. TA3]|uniref:hypothetical protein n=1 Tax=Tundrisphaera sp. TA3 TaxID=3435775 RepID=UPI003EB98C40
METETKKTSGRSDALATINRLTQQLEAVKSEAKGYRQAKRSASEEALQYKVQIEDLRKKLDELQNKKQPSADERLEELENLRNEVRKNKHKDAFSKVAKELGIREDALEDAYALSGYAPNDDEPNDEAIKETLSSALSSRPYLKVEAPKEKKLAPGPGASRGNSSKNVFYVTEAQMSDPQWMFHNQSKLAEATLNGTVKIESN